MRTHTQKISHTYQHIYTHKRKRMQPPPQKNTMMIDKKHNLSIFFLDK